MCLNLYQDIYILYWRGSGGDVSWERERTPRIILRSGMEDCLSHHNELFFHHFGANPTHVTGVGGVPSANDLHQHPRLSANIFHPLVVLITGENISGLVWYMLLLLRIFVKNIKPWSRSPSSRPVIWARKVPPWSRAVSADARRNTVGPPTPP